MRKKIVKGVNDLITLIPGLEKEWDYKKNTTLNIEEISLFSNKNVFWECEKGHQWSARISNRSNGRGCPYCINLKVLKGENDLMTLRPNLVKEWNYERNINLKPENFVPGSNKKVWWKCNRGHEWQARISDRSRGTQCPYCRKKKLIRDENDLATLYPELAQEWNYEKNSGIKPESVTPGSSLRVWWKCERGHEWEALIYNRSRGKGCPVCLNKRVLAGYNDLETNNPSLAKEWNYEKNKDLLPSMVTPHSNKRVWWKCIREHEWQAKINIRNSGEKIKGCPYCSGHKPVVGINDLQTLYPQLVKEWNYKKNSGLLPTMVLSHSNKKVWWICSQGHEWKAMIGSRTNGRSCPYCSGRLAIKGETDLITVNPDLANQWNYAKNGELKPKDLTFKSNKKVWWICSQGHEWKATVNHRSSGCSCPYCHRN